MRSTARAFAAALTVAALGIAGSCQGSRTLSEPEPPKIPERAPEAPPPARTLDLAFFLRRLVDLDGLAVLEEGIRTSQFSSYDRKSRWDEAAGKYVDWDANGDAGQYLRAEPSGEAVLAEMEGPGCIWRIWSANPQGRIRFYFDGSPAPNLEMDFNRLFSGDLEPFARPLVWQRRLALGGNNPASDCYFPIPYGKSCKVTADKAYNQYYHIGYSTFLRSWNVKTFSPDLSPEEMKALLDVALALSSSGQDPQPRAGLKEFELKTVLEPGQKADLCELEGPATIHRFLAKATPRERWGRRKVLLEVFWDGGKAPAVQAPLADFFGDAWDEAPYKSLPLGITADLNYSYFRMPFERSAKVTVTNLGSKPCDLAVKIAYLPGTLPPGAARFHARWRRDRGSADFDYPLLECTGRGRFVGVALFPHNLAGDWWGEGDEKVYVDGEKFPSTFGTGSEDYFGDAWGIRGFANPFHGCPTPEEEPRQSCYRWHISDSIPFSKSFRMTIENYTALGKAPARNDYSSVAFWYQAPGGSDFFAEPPKEDYAPRSRAVRGAIEAESVITMENLPKYASIITDGDLPRELSGGKAVKIQGPAGTTVPFGLPAPEEGQYTIEPVPAEGFGASSFEILREGAPIGEKVRLAKGSNLIILRLTGAPVEGDRCKVVLDYFLLHPYRNFIRKWYLTGPFDNANAEGFDRPYGPETEPFRADQAFQALGGEARWRKVEARSGIITSDGKYFRQKDDIVLYAYCEVESPEDQKGTAFAGSDDGVKVWVNGKLAHSKAARRILTPDQDRFEVELKRGRNAILLKVDQGGGPWGFAFRIDDPEGKLKAILPE